MSARACSIESLRRTVNCLQIAHHELSGSNGFIDVDSELDDAVEWLKSMEVRILPNVRMKSSICPPGEPAVNYSGLSLDPGAH